jgi:hypothetical protein
MQGGASLRPLGLTTFDGEGSRVMAMGLIWAQMGLIWAQMGLVGPWSFCLLPDSSSPAIRGGF